MISKVEIIAITCVTITLVIATSSMIPLALAQQNQTQNEGFALENMLASSATNATGTEKTFVALLSCNTAQPDFSQPLEPHCDVTTLVPAP